MKKITSIILTMAITLFLLINPVSAFTFSPPFEISSQSAYMINLDTGDVVYEKNADRQQMPSHLAQVMTAIIVLENIADIDNTEVTCPVEVFIEFDNIRAEYPNTYIPNVDYRPNETAKAVDLLYAMMLGSAAEAASSLARFVGNGNTATFVDMMNKKAEELGCTNTVFLNPTGIYQPGQLTTAKEMAIITQYALKVPRFKDIANTYSYTLQPTNKHAQEWTITHTNIMTNPNSEYYYEPARGIKTGNSPESRRALLMTGTKSGNNYLLVLLNAPLVDENGENRFYHLEDGEALFNWALDSFAYTKILDNSEPIGEVEVKFGDDSDHVLVKPAEEFSRLWLTTIDVASIKQDINMVDSIIAPVEKGDKLGEMTLTLSGEELYKVDLVSIDSVEVSDLAYKMELAKDFPNSKWFKIAIYIGIFLTALYIVLFIVILKKSNRRYSYASPMGEKRKKKPARRNRRIR